jgi:hypothetical protein
VDLYLKADPPAAIADVRVVVEHLAPGAGGKLLPPAAGEVVLTVLSPEALRREPEQVSAAIRAAAGDGPPVVILVEGAESLRDDELGVVQRAAELTDRIVILRILEGT